LHPGSSHYQRPAREAAHASTASLQDIYNLSKVDSINAGPAATGHGFNIIGVHGRPVAGFLYERREEAEAAHKLIGEAIVKAKLIAPMTLP
jgi:hypothetical protein